MKYFFAGAICLFFALNIQAQFSPVENVYQSSFEQAYQLYPAIPKGVLEAVSYNQTRITHLTSHLEPSCTGMPQYVGVMGLIENGKNYFNENLRYISSISGKDVTLLLSNPHEEILAYALTYNHVISAHGKENASTEDKLSLLSSLTEIPLHLNLRGNNYAFDAFLYVVIQFMNNASMQAYYNFPSYSINGEAYFGESKWRVLSATHVFIHPDYIENAVSEYYVANEDLQADEVRSADYGPALWNPAASCNYSSRSGTAISAVTEHTVQGSYSGCISWFQNCAASVSAHYVVRSSDGQVTQQVLEADKAWHVGTENPYTVGIEHEGYVSNPAWYTTAMYNSSAALSANIATDNGINDIRTGWWPWLATTNYNSSSIPGGCTRIKGHQHYPNQTHTDPGQYWDWNRFFKLIHPTPTPTMITSPSGNFFDSGGSAGNYGNDERTITVFSPPGATNVTVTFSSFNLENTWDYLYIYDGDDIWDPLIGYYTGTSNPGTVTSTGGQLTFEFRSDCSTVNSGWQATFTSNAGPGGGDSIPPVTTLSVPGAWQTTDFAVNFNDSDEVGGSGLKKSYYHVSYFDGSGFYANANRGFLRDEFDLATLHPQWTQQTGTWNLTSGYLEQSDEASGNTNLFASLKQDLSNVYVYEFSAAIGGAGANRRAGFHFFCDSAQLTNRGNSYFVWLRVDNQTLEFYKVTNDVFSLEHTENITMNADQWYNYKVMYDRIVGNIKVFRDNVLLGEWTDVAPYSTGKYISFRSGNANLKVNNIKVYRSRYSNTTTNVVVGNCALCDLPYQNPNPSTPAGAVFTFSSDSANNLSAITNEMVNVDWTAPDTIYYVNDISIFDEDTITSSNLAGGNWNISSDTHSGISRYMYCVGTTPGDSDLIGWTDNWFYTNYLDTVTLVANQWYYTSVKAENGAGLQNTPTPSDGFVFINLALDNEPEINLTVYPNPASSGFWISGLTQGEEYSIAWMDTKGAIIFSNQLMVNGSQAYMMLPLSIANGNYLLRLFNNHEEFTIKLTVNR